MYLLPLPLSWRALKILEGASLRASALWPPQLETISVLPGSGDAVLAAIGDIYLGGIHLFDARNLLGSTFEILQNADVRTGNLEAMLTAHGCKAGVIGSYMKAPPSNISILEEAHFNILTLANNHAFDYGTEGLSECMDLLCKAGIRFCGVRTRGELPEPAALLVKGIRVGFLGYCDTHAAASQRPALSPACAGELEISKALEQARRQFDIVVLHLHWGYEFALHPLLRHRDRARRFAERGADVVLCHHAHVPLGFEVWKNSFIAYGLGNGIFRHNPYLRAGHPWTDRSFILRIRFSKNGIHKAEVHPFRIHGNGSMELLAGVPRRAFLAALDRMSRRLKNTEWLRKIEQSRMIYEAVHLLRSIYENTAATEKIVLDRVLGLRMERERELARYLHEEGDSFGQRASQSLSELEEASIDSSVVQNVIKRTEPEFRNEIEPGLAAHYRWRHAFASRLPW